MPDKSDTTGLTAAMVDVLEILRDHPDETILCSGIECYAADRRVHRGTINALLRLCAITKDDWSKEEYYTINSTGLALLRKPELARDIRIALSTLRAFTIIEDRVVPL